MKQLNKAILWEGPSLIDDQPIVAIATFSGANKKTGEVVQTYILRQDMDPRLASKTGADFSICGNCIMRGTANTEPSRKQAKGKRCYVKIFQGPLIVWNAYQSGKYPKTNSIAELGRGREVRLGTYGDPLAVPMWVWEQLISESNSHLGYTHQSDIITMNKKIFMASADSLEDAKKFWKQGARTFRIIQNLDEMQENEILCPASKEAKRRTTCAKCKLCSGTSSNSKKSIAIVEH